MITTALLQPQEYRRPSGVGCGQRHQELTRLLDCF